ncbi:MAG: sulfotransferase domain-containing protein [Candidatus Staskawiczbacteria bacterium]|nr:sulfotransferase domain-containing protein [Candidatus Staskawiczbacteria bacterium]
MRKIICVTFPRSGHHLLVNLLLKYYSKDLNYLETSGDKTDTLCSRVLTAGDMHYCELYNHCKQIPCSDPKTNFQKTHDFDLSLQPSNDFFYIILYRNPLDSIVSHFNYYLHNNMSSFFASDVNFNRKGWEEFANKDIEFWKNFVKKWLVWKNDTNRIYVSYEELIKSPHISFINILKFINPNSKIDLNLLSALINRLNIEKKNNIKDFDYYNEGFFSDLEKKVKKEMDLLDLDLKFN